jgi:hypothetical protein
MDFVGASHMLSMLGRVDQRLGRASKTHLRPELNVWISSYSFVFVVEIH